MHEDVLSIVERLGADDRAEICELGVDAAAVGWFLSGPCVVGRIFLHDDLPTAAVAFHALTPRALAVSMIATDDFAHVAGAVERWAARVALPLIAEYGYTRVECRVMEARREVTGLIARLGFRLECRLERFGANGAAFCQYAWRLADHLLFATPGAEAQPGAVSNTIH